MTTNKLKPILITANKDEIIFKTEVEEMVYKTDINSFIENTGVTVQNISFPINGYYINLGDISETFICGNILENIFYELKQDGIKNSLIIINFDGVEELSENFMKEYTKLLLQTSNKIITIHMNTGLSNQFGTFILTNINDVNEEEVEE